MPADSPAAPPEPPARLPPLAARLVERTAALLAALPPDAPADFRAGAERMAQAAERFAAAVNSAGLSRHDRKGLLNRGLGGGQILHRKHPGGFADALTMPATIGEFGIIEHLLVTGRPHAEFDGEAAHPGDVTM